MFNRLLFAVIVLGAFLGFVLPSGEEQQAAESSAKSAVPPVDTVLEREANGHFFVTATVNGQPVRFLVDTGASSVVLTSKDARHVGLDFDPGDFRVIGRGASGHVRGTLIKLDHVQIDQKRIENVSAAIAAEGLDVSLLGQSYLSRIGSVSIAGDRMTLR